jgi:hypothetical protein
MGLLIILDLLAVPAILIAIITRFRGHQRSDFSNEDLRMQIDGPLGRMESDLAHLTEEKQR